MNRRIPTALVLAGLISGGCTYLLEKKVKFLTSAEQRNRLRYVAPARALAAGEVLKAADLDWAMWPAGDPLGGAILHPEAVLGRVVLYPVEKGQPLLERGLAAPGIGAGLGSKIPSGMRALALRSDEVVGVAGFLAPGSRLDVLVTYRAENAVEAVTATVLQNAEVLAAGQQAEPDPAGKPSIATVVTLLVTPAEAERAVAASTGGVIHFVLRNQLDKQQVESAPVTLSWLGGAPRAPAALPAPSPALHEAPAPFRPGGGAAGVETIFGDSGGNESGGNSNGIGGDGGGKGAAASPGGNPDANSHASPGGSAAGGFPATDGNGTMMARSQP